MKLVNKIASVTLLTAAALGISAPQAAADPLKIGFAVSLTGYLAPYDSPTLDGALIAIDDLNAEGGAAGKYKIEAMVKDVRSDTVQTSVAVQELIDDGAAIIVVPCDDDPAIAGGLLAQAAEIPVFSTCATNAALPEAIGSFYFTNYVADTLQGATLAEYAHELGLKKAFILVCPDTTYTANLPRYFATTFEKLGGKLIGEGSYAFGQQDFSAEVTRIKALTPQPDVIMTSAYEPDFPAFIKQLRGAGINATVMGSDGIDSPTTVALGSVAEGIVFTNAGRPVPGTRLADFFAEYEKVKGEPLTNSFAATGYDMLLVINHAVGVAGTLKGPAVRDAIANTENLDVVTGTISYKGRGHVPLRAIALNQISEGRANLIDTRVPNPALVPEPIK